MFLNRAALVLLVLGVALSQRYFVSFLGGQVAPFTAAFIMVAAVIWVRDSAMDPQPSPYRAVGLNTVGPLLALMFVLPLLGVLLGWYPVASLYALILPAFVVAVLSLARAQRLHGLDLTKAGFALIVIHGAYGLGQTLFRLGLMPAMVWQPAADWDASSQLALSEAYLITSRSTGLFVNANLFGMWSCLALVFSSTYLRGKTRVVGIALGVLGVLGSQSRTALLGLAVLAAILLVRLLRDGRVAGRVFAASLIVAPVLLAAWIMGWLGQLVEVKLVDRLASGLGVVEGGAAADQNLLGRVDAWSRAADFSNQYPFGTFGPPGVHFQSFIDNGYVSMFLQGSLVLLGTYILALFSPLVLARRGVPRAGALAAVSLLVAVFSLTLQPFESSTNGAALAWLMAAISLGTVLREGSVVGDLAVGSVDAHGEVARRSRR